MKARAAATPIALLVLAAATIAYAYLVEGRTVSDADRASRRNDVFPTFRVDQVSRVEIEHGRDAFVIERDRDAGPGAPMPWVIGPARQELADPVAVDALLRELELATRLRDIADGAALGFDPPRARGNVKVGPVEYRFEVGADAPRPEGGAYMRVKGEGTFVVGRSVKVQLLRDADAYRDRTLVALGASETARLDVRAADGRGFALQRDGATFRVVGTGMRASRSAAEGVFGALADARAESFLDDRTASAPTDGGITVTLVPRDASRQHVILHVGGSCPGQPEDVVVVRVLEQGGTVAGPAPSSAAACTAERLVDALRATTESLIDSSPLFAHADEIEQVRLEALAIGGPRVELARKASGWHERSPEERDLDAEESDAANDLTLSLANARAVEARRAGPNERFTARARVSIVRGGDGASEAIEIGASDADGSVLARRVDDGAILRLSRAVGRRFEPNAVALRARGVWNPTFDAGAVVAIDNGCARAPEHLELRGQTWAMRAPAGFSVDPASVVDLTDAIAHAKADAWIAERDDGSFGFDGPVSCMATLTLRGEGGHPEPRRVSLAFGAAGEGGVYARTLGDPAVFVAPQVVRDLVSRSAVDRSRLRFDPSELAKVTLAKGADRLVLERSGDRLTRAPRDQDAMGDDPLQTALAGFYALAAVHTGRPSRAEGMDRPMLEITARTAAVAGVARTIQVSIGGETHLDGQEVYFARATGIDATFAVPRGAVSAILNAW